MQIRITVVLAICIFTAVASAAAMAIASRSASARDELVKASIASLQAETADVAGKLEDVALDEIEMARALRAIDGLPAPA